jgi:transcriptional regulator with GAF, ATPase, and Fis domain
MNGSLREGLVADRYELLRPLRRDEFIEVLEGRDIFSGRVVQAKRLLRGSTPRDPRDCPPLLREFLILSYLSHKALPKVVDFGLSASGVRHLVIEDGGECTQLDVWAKTHPSLQACLSWWGSLLSALEYLHAVGVTHGGISPAFVAVRADEELRTTEARLTDLHRASWDSHAVVRNRVSATSSFKRFAPEDARAGFRCDAHGAVVVMSWLLVTALLGAPAPSAPPAVSLESIRSVIPESLHRALTRMLVGDESSRPSSISDVWAVLSTEGTPITRESGLQVRPASARGMVPRRNVTQLLDSFLGGLRDRPGRLIAVIGPMGSGKTYVGRLCQTEAHARGLRYVVGADGIRALGRAMFGERPATLSSCSVAYGESLSGKTGGRSPVERGAEPEFGEAAVCFIDDLDKLTRDDVSHLASMLRSAKSSKIPVSAVACCGQLPLSLLEGADFILGKRETLGKPSADCEVVVEVHNLGGMSVSETGVLLGELTCRPASQELADWMTTKTGGNPLFVSELTSSLVRRGGLSDGPNGTTLASGETERLDVPASVASVLLEETAALGRDEGVVARVASLGPGISMDVLGAVTDLTDADTRRAASALQIRGILQAEDQGDFIAFRHDLLRDAVYGSMTDSTREELHGAVAGAIVAGNGLRTPSAEWHGTLAWHLYRSASPREALKPALVAAVEFEQGGNAERALDCLRIAEHLTIDIDAGEEVLRSISNAYRRLGRASDCARVLARLLRLLEARGSVSSEAIVEVECALGRELTLGGDADSALAILGRASHLARDLDNPTWIAKISNNVATIHQMRGEFASIDAIADENISLLGNSPDYETLSSSYNVKGNAQHALCNWQAAVSWYDKSVHYALLADMPRLARASICNKGLALMYLGAWDQSDHCFDRVVALTRAEVDAYAVEMLSVNRGTLLQRRGALRQAAVAFRDAVDAARQCGDTWGQALAISNMGELESLRDGPSSALALYDRAEDLMRQVGARDDFPELLRRRACALLTLGRLESALELVEQAGELARAMGNRLEVANCLRVRGVIHIRRKDHQREKRWLEEAVSTTRQLGAPYELALSLTELALAEIDGGASEQVIPRLGEALHILLGLGARRDARLVQEELARAAGRLPTPVERLPDDRTRLASLYDASRSLATADSVQDLLRETADIAAAAVPATVVAAILTVQQPALMSVISAMTADMDQYGDAVRRIAATTMADSSSSSAFILGAESASPSLRAALSDAAAGHVLLVPIVSSTRTLGAIYLDYREGDGQFSDQDVSFLEALAAQAAVALENALLRTKLQDEVEYLRWEIDGRSSFSNIIGQSLEMQKLFTLLQKVSRTSVTVLIEGESGTGKELAARAIHFNGPRKSGRFLAQNCAALPEQLLESELFGHVRGAFTGAMREKPGLFEAADGGTFFLDEIADMPPSLQVKLLRVLQDGEIRRVGATDPQRVDVRIIAATNKTLEDEVKAGRFREDLFYRLNVVRIEMPPLRDRRDDIPLLAQYFLDAFSKDMNDAPRGFSDGAMELLVNYDWPGNVRELENEVQRALALTDPGLGIGPSVLSERIRSVRIVVHPPKPGTTLSLKDMVTDVEKRVILQVLTENNWNRSRTAELLGLSRQGLLKKIARFGLKPDTDGPDGSA